MTSNDPSLLAVYAHPDDETFRCGGTLALLAAQGVKVTILTFTRGQAGSCGTPPLCSREVLGTVRTQELICSCNNLGIQPPVVLDYQDGMLKQVNPQEAEDVITKWIEKIKPTVFLTWPLDGLSGHSDHIAVSQWTTNAFHHTKGLTDSDHSSLYYLAVPHSIARDLNMTHLHATPDTKITATINVQSVWDQKLAAIACHRTQSGESPILHAPHQKQLRFLGWEHFYRAHAGKSDDLLTSLSQKYMEMK